MKNVLILFISALLICFAGCDENDPSDDTRNIVGTGPIVTQTLTLDVFSKIENSGVANFYITRGNPQSVVLKAQQNIIDVMKIGVQGEVLQVGLNDNVSIEQAEEIRFEIIIPEITSVTLTGVGDFNLSGDYQEELTILLTGVGNVKAFDQEVGTCDITITGVADCEVHVRNELIVDIVGVGNIYYKGNPNIDSNISGVGALINAN